MSLEKHDSHALTYAKLLLTATFWGGTFIAARKVVQHVEPFSAAFLRFTIASVILSVAVHKLEGGFTKIDRSQLLPLLVLGLTGIFSYNFFFFEGLKYVQASRASIIVATNPIFIALLSALIYHEKLNLKRLLGITLSVAGAMVVISQGDLMRILHGGFGRGELLILGCVASWVVYSLIGKSVMHRMPPLVAVTYSSIVGTFVLLFAALNEGMLRNLPVYSLEDWVGLAYLGIFGTVLGFLWYYEGIRQIGPTRASQFINFVPVSAVVLAFLVLGEPVTLALLVGGAFVTTGVYLTRL